VQILSADKMRNNPYVRYSGMAVQFLCTIGAGVWGGMQLDAWQQNNFPAWTLGLSLLATVGALVGFIKSLPKE
jgi:hypothetical protein